ncbi:MAG: DUF2087 domain-containing protein [Betaproteobacteria bacterium]|nr:DUF2087 domain-containing protein [Betaproteobacteria bacterium]
MNPSREMVPLHTADVSLFCKNLRQQLSTAGIDVPGHLTLLNMVARSAGYRNFQTLKARPPAEVAMPVAEVAPPAPAELPPIELARGSTVPLPIRRLLTCFDTGGRLMRMPNKFAAQQMAIWAIWSRLPAHRELSEKQINDYIARYHTFGDVATLRRELVNAKLLWRTQDCRVYRKEMQRPSEETKQFLDLLFEHATAAIR